jgi:hypothetical protein
MGQKISAYKDSVRRPEVPGRLACPRHRWQNTEIGLRETDLTMED